ncbi:MAG: hypothetical protein WA913_01870 [Pricia sp.]
MKNIVSLLLIFAFVPMSCQEKNPNILPPDIQIKTATLPAPEADRADAMVYGYDDNGEMTVLREGGNNLVCIADDPNKEGISVACYSKKLEPFMKRGRELTAEGSSAEEKEEIRAAEAESGELQMPDEPSMLYVYSGSDESYDKTTGELGDGQYRYVIYTPYATTESTGLPGEPHAKGMPWLMDPGTHKAHIMVGPFD